LVQPATADRYRQQGLNYRQQGDLERAVATLTLAAALDPRNPEGYIILGWTQHLAGQRPAAIASLHRALAQSPDSVSALNALGIVYLVAGDLAAAVSTHNRAITLQPDNEIAHYNPCPAPDRQAQWDQAIHHGQRATQLEPANPHPWVALALAYSAAGDGARARASYDQALALDGGYGQRSYLDHLEQAGFSGEQIRAIAALIP
jgi:Flp pilus assembly protein TadD